MIPENWRLVLAGKITINDLIDRIEKKEQEESDELKTSNTASVS